MSNTVAKAELEKMLELLNTNIIDAINRKIVAESPYTFGIKPLLTYAPETLVKYLAAIITFVVEPLEGAGADLSEEEVDTYSMKWLVHYDRVRDALSEASTELKARLLRIAETPPVLEPPLVYDKENEYTLICDYFDGNSYELYPQFTDFLYSGLSPLRRRYITDQRILDLTKEADDLLVPHNKALERFIRRELNRLRSLVNGRIRYANLESADINYLKANKNHLPEVEWQSLENALNVGSLSASDLKSIKTRIMELKKPVPLPAPPKPLMPADDYINFFLQGLGLAYGRFNTKREEFYSCSSLNATLDDMTAHIYAFRIAKAQNTDLSNIEAQQKQAEEFYLDFNNIKTFLAACIQIDLNSLSVDEVFTSETQAHGIIQGMLAFTAKHKSHLKSRYRLFNYDRLVEELHHLLHEHTKGFTEALPPPSIELLSKEAVASIPKAPRLTSSLAPPYFDLTVPIAKVLGDISADTATTSTEVLLEVPAQDLLVPVQDGMIKRLSHYLLGNEQAVPYLMEGELVIHDTEANIYHKIIPTLREDGYLDYVFNAYGYKTLLRRTLKLRKLLNEPGYYPSALPKGQKALLKDLETLVEWDKTLIAKANELSTCEGYEHVQAELLKILGIHYYKTIYIGAHKLAAYTFYPAEYTTFISANPIDPTTGKPLVYHVHHKNLCRSDNTPENLEIITKQLNDELRSTSRPVFYQGKNYNTLKAYCEATEAGARTKLTERLSALTPGTEAIEYNGRLYTIDTVGVITATDDTATTPTITYSGVTYANLKEFANAHKLVYKSLHNALSKARKDNKTSFKYKYHQFYLDDKGNIIEVTK